MSQSPQNASEPKIDLTKYAWWSLYAALTTMVLKMAAYWLTNSISLLSDALESLVNVAGALIAMMMLKIAARPPDEDHEYGHAKAEYFSSGAEGTLIVVAAISIAYEAINRLMNPHPIEALGFGIASLVVASALNFFVAKVLLEASKKHNSITLEANAKHLLTDVWTSLGVIVAIILVVATGWQILDPIIGLILAVNIVWTGYTLMRESALGLMDTALPIESREQIQTILQEYEAKGVQFHALRTRKSGAHGFVSMHVLVDGDWTVQRGHELLEEIEGRIHLALPNTNVFTHLESIDDEASYKDIYLDRRIDW
jgi:cation diffusion facilitator family transporter